MIIKTYKIDGKAVSALKKVIELPEAMVEGKWQINEFARNGYLFQSAVALGMKGDEYYLYIKGEEPFFKANEQKIKLEGVTELKGKEYDEIKSKFEAGEESVAAGVGAVFDF